MDNENASKINWLGAASLVLSALILLILLGILIVLNLAFVQSNNPGAITTVFWYYLAGFFDTFIHFSEKVGVNPRVIVASLTFPLWGLPLGILNIIVAIFARKRGSARQKKVAGMGIRIGILGFLISACLFFNFLLLVITGH